MSNTRRETHINKYRDVKQKHNTQAHRVKDTVFMKDELNELL